MKRVDQAYRQLRREILEGALPPGTALSEADLALRLGVSRTPVREALARLASESMVEIEPRRAARVASWRPEDQVEVYELRLLLEGLAAGTAARLAVEGDIADLDRLCVRADELLAERRLDVVEFAENSRNFHQRLVAITGRPRLQSMVSNLVNVPSVVESYHHFSREAFARSSSHHREIVSALRAGNERWAANVMRAHILAAQEERARRDSAALRERDRLDDAGA